MLEYLNSAVPSYKTFLVSEPLAPLSQLFTMQTICVSFYDFEQDALLPQCLRQYWRAELCPIIRSDIQQGLFGGRRCNLWWYSAVYRFNLGVDSLYRIRADLQSFAECDERHMSSLRELLANTNVWLSFETIQPDELLGIRRAGIIEQLPSPHPPTMIGAACGAPSHASTSVRRIMVNEGPHVSSASSSSTTLATQSTSQFPSVQTREEYERRYQDSKASLGRDLCSSPPPDHPRHLPLDRRIKAVTESSRAKKTHLVFLDPSSIEAFGGYGTLAGPEYWRQATRDRRYGVFGRFLQTVGLRTNKLAPRQTESWFEGGTRVADDYEDSDGVMAPRPRRTADNAA